ncbi:hypothetical protein PAXRUDRAFT_389455 [Paxillus rubicundulus Ve08.2h10]|uniref:Secreted protein n=1 Tax=Paxillus rubicundulus Ve08.2h10 TaxID=930991 RepID=A0A0D0C269_9AGAM|nr:hypothetical protein PAXRUDRAFT_389455 [Paxillus rubicundulus Ve08.2h10]
MSCQHIALTLTLVFACNQSPTTVQSFLVPPYRIFKLFLRFTCHPASRFAALYFILHCRGLSVTRSSPNSLTALILPYVFSGQLVYRTRFTYIPLSRRVFVMHNILQCFRYFTVKDNTCSALFYPTRLRSDRETANVTRPRVPS